MQNQKNQRNDIPIISRHKQPFSENPKSEIETALQPANRRPTFSVTSPVLGRRTGNPCSDIFSFGRAMVDFNFFHFFDFLNALWVNYRLKHNKSAQNNKYRLNPQLIEKSPQT